MIGTTDEPVLSLARQLYKQDSNGLMLSDFDDLPAWQYMSYIREARSQLQGADCQ